MQQRFVLYLLIVWLLSLGGCAKPINISALSISSNYCQPSNYYPQKSIIRYADNSVISLHNQLPNYSLHNLYTANASGVLPLLLRLDSLKNDQDESKNTVRQNILLSIQQLSEEIDGLAATLDCEGEKTDQVANYLDKINQQRNNKLTISSIIVGALTTIATVAIEKKSVQNTVAISGGVLGGGMAALTINPSGKKVKWSQENNLLGSIWFADNSNNTIPPSIWYMLNEKMFSNNQKNTLIESIKNRWLTINFKDDLSSEDEYLFFNKGGTYTAEDLHLRANMLNELQATVRSLHQDLASLTNNISENDLTKR